MKDNKISLLQLAFLFSSKPASSKSIHLAFILKRTLHRNNTHRLRCVAFDVLIIVLTEINSISQPAEPINASKPLVFGDTVLWSKSSMKRLPFALDFPLLVFSFLLFFHFELYCFVMSYPHVYFYSLNFKDYYGNRRSG
jgi:hypothetical protein